MKNPFCGAVATALLTVVMNGQTSAAVIPSRWGLKKQNDFTHS
jgi:hypothetical protein